MSWPTSVLCGVVLDENGQVLLCPQGAGWRLPAAELPGGEMVVPAVQQIVREQTGLEARAVRLVGLYTSEPKSRVVASFQITRFEGQVRSGEWFAPDALPEDLEARDRERIADAVQFRGEIFQR